MKVVTISSWLNFGRSAPREGGLRRVENLLAPPYYSQHEVFASLWELFFIKFVIVFLTGILMCLILILFFYYWF